MARVTISDVAAASGVSRATVSLVLRENPKIPRATAMRVREAMANLGYVYSRQAANLRTQRTTTMGLILPGVRDPWYADLMMAVEDRVRQAGCTLLTGYSRDLPEREAQLITVMTEQQVNGLLVVPTSRTRGPELTTAVRGRSAPHVIVDRQLPTYEADFVGVENINAAIQVAHHLASLGVSRVAYVGGPASCVVRAEREQGLRLGLAEHGLSLGSVTTVEADEEQLGGSDATDRLLAAPEPPQAIVAYADSVAFGVIAALERLGMKPGREVAVVGFDDIDASSNTHPTLTTVATFPENLAAQSVGVLLDRIADPSAPFRTLRYEAALQIRETTLSWSS